MGRSRAEILTPTLTPVGVSKPSLLQKPMWRGGGLGLQMLGPYLLSESPSPLGGGRQLTKYFTRLLGAGNSIPCDGPQDHSMG